MKSSYFLYIPEEFRESSKKLVQNFKTSNECIDYRIAQAAYLIVEFVSKLPESQLKYMFTYAITNANVLFGKKEKTSCYKSGTNNVFLTANSCKSIYQTSVTMVHELAHLTDFCCYKKNIHTSFSTQICLYDSILIDVNNLIKEKTLPQKTLAKTLLGAYSANEKTINFLDKVINKARSKDDPEIGFVTEIISGYYKCLLVTGGHTHEQWMYQSKKQNYEIAYATEVFAAYIEFVYDIVSRSTLCNGKPKLDIAEPLFPNTTSLLKNTLF